MPKMMHITMSIDLSDNVWEQATQMVALKPIMEKFEADLQAAGVKCNVNTDTATTRAKTAPTGAKRGRKPKLQVIPTIPDSDDPEAA